LWRNQGKSTEARDLIAPIYGWYTEGFEDCRPKTSERTTQRVQSIGRSGAFDDALVGKRGEADLFRIPIHFKYNDCGTVAHLGRFGAKPDKKIVDRSSGEPELMEDACPARDRGFTT
jgi:hypothetical protein